MSMPDLSKLQYYSGANSFKNDGFCYVGSMDFPTSIPAGSFITTTQSFTIPSSPQFSMLYGYYQEYEDTNQQYSVGSGYNGPQWYQTNVNNRVGLIVTSPSGSAGPLDATIYTVINGNTITVTSLVNNPYPSTAITIQALNVPWAYIEYTLSN